MKDTDNLSPIEKDILLAEMWANPSDLAGNPPGQGEGWRHTCYRLAKFAKKALNPHRIVTCIYCGKEYPDGTPTSQNRQLTQHIKVCKQHPLRMAEERIHDLGQALVEAKLDRDRAVLEAREIIKNVGAASINNVYHARLAAEWMQRWFPQ